MASKACSRVLCLLDTKTGALSRFVRAKAPRWAGDLSQVEETHKAEVCLETIGGRTHLIEKFRKEPEYFFPKEKK